MQKGKIVVIEGTDCSGKETQSKRLVETLNDNGMKAIRFSYPHYDSPTGKIIAGAYLGKPEVGESFFEKPVDLDPKIAGLYYAADRKYDAPRVKQYLDNGYIVVLDRYVNSNMSHQGSKLKEQKDRFAYFKWVEELEYGLLELPKPDYTFFLYVPLEISRELKKERLEKPDKHESDEQYLQNAENTYLELAKLYDYITINCVEKGKIRSIEDISIELYNKVKELII